MENELGTPIRKWCPGEPQQGFNIIYDAQTGDLDWLSVDSERVSWLGVRTRNSWFLGDKNDFRDANDDLIYNQPDETYRSDWLLVRTPTSIGVKQTAFARLHADLNCRDIRDDLEIDGAIYWFEGDQLWEGFLDTVTGGIHTVWIPEPSNWLLIGIAAFALLQHFVFKNRQSGHNIQAVSG